MGSIIAYEDMERLYETEGATLLRRPWGRSYDETIGPDPGGTGVVFPASGMGMLLPCPRTIARWVESPCHQPWLFEHPKKACETWEQDCRREVESRKSVLGRVASLLGL